MLFKQWFERATFEDDNFAGVIDPSGKVIIGGVKPEPPKSPGWKRLPRILKYPYADHHMH